MVDEQMEGLFVQVAEDQQSRFYGKYRGIVSDTDDPQNIGRLKADVPSIYGDEVTSPWALPCAPYAGDGVGNYMIPPVGAGVWIEFEAGDISMPIWSGAWWGQDQLPKDEGGASANPAMKIIRTDDGLMAVLDDDNETIAISDSRGRNLIKIRVQEGIVYIKGTSKAVIEAPQIELVENALHPVVFGDELMTYLAQVVTIFNAHMHPGETLAGIPIITPAPPQPNLPPPSPTLLSMKVKSG